MKIREVINFLDELAPPQYQESYDNAGLIVGDADMEIKGVIVCLDSTEEVIDDAIARRCNLVIAHHPIIFSGLKTITGENYITKTIIKAIKNDIAIFAIHTNLDNMLNNGVNTKICDKLKLVNRQALIPKQPIGEDNREVGTGMIAYLNEPMKSKDFLAYLKDKMETNIIKYTQPVHDQIHKIAICGGSGSFLLSKAMEVNADVFISGDFKYHEYFDANNKIVIADIGHYESEKFTIELLLELIQKKFTTFAGYCTLVDTNPVNYYI